MAREVEGGVEGRRAAVELNLVRGNDLQLYIFEKLRLASKATVELNAGARIECFLQVALKVAVELILEATLKCNLQPFIVR